VRAHQWPNVRGWHGLGAHRATRKGESTGRAAASRLSAEGGAALLWGLGLMIAVAGRLRQSLRVARRGTAHTWHSVGLATPSLETLLWALLAVAIGVGVGLAMTLL
jgi:hypothetical protein